MIPGLMLFSTLLSRIDLSIHIIVAEKWSKSCVSLTCSSPFPSLFWIEHTYTSIHTTLCRSNERLPWWVVKGNTSTYNSKISTLHQSD